jgi:hypothetical protein
MNLLHVANGSSTTTLIEAAGLPGRTMVWCDPLYDGPVPDVPDEELVRIRARFHASSPDAIDSVAADFKGWRTAVDDHRSHDELVLWFEHDLFDQLNLVQLLTHLGRWGPLIRPVTLVSIDAHPGHPNFKGLGELSAPEIAALFEARSPVSRASLALAPDAWDAFRSPDPKAIEAFLTTDTTAMPFLAAALKRHLEEFPWHADGLSRSERRLMSLVREGPVDARRVFVQMHEGETAYYLTDTSFRDRVRELANTSPPLLTLVGGAEGTPASLRGTIALTQAGRDVLAGTLDRVRLCGIDRWLGGAHLTGHGPVWRWHGRTGKLVND